MTEMPAPGTVAAFRARVPAPMNSNTHFGSQYGDEVRRIVTGHAARQPRSLQKHLGPSEIGAECDRQVAGKMAGLPTTNHVADPWPSIVGTATHAWLADCFDAENTRLGYRRFLTETKVAAHDNHPGTADLYDWNAKAVVDHKVLGDNSLQKVQSKDGPSRRYVVQLLEYGEGFRRAGLPVERVMLVAYPRTASSLSRLYVWEREHTEADDLLLKEVHDQTETRYAWAQALASGQATLTDVPDHPDDTECYFCPFYRPQSAYDGGVGCPGNRIDKTHN